jgi:NAD(P)H-flavin reductase
VKTLLISFLLASWPSMAQMRVPCSPREEMTKFLSEKHEESQIGAGIHHAGPLVELFFAEETRTWSILVTNTKGVACLIASGQDWQRSEPNVAAN